MMESTARPAARVIVVMGVASSGKTTIGTMLAERLAWPYRDADSFHPPANVAKMSSGLPLDDTDRAPWLDAIATWIQEQLDHDRSGVVSCSALRRAYRDRVVAGRPGVRIVHLVGDRALIAERMSRRKDHFMPASLLDSQFETLEPPAPDENVLAVDVSGTPAHIVDEIIARLALCPATR